MKYLFLIKDIEARPKKNLEFLMGFELIPPNYWLVAVLTTEEHILQIEILFCVRLMQITWFLIVEWSEQLMGH